MIILMIACIPDTTSPGTDDHRPSRAETETVPGRTSREFHPSEDLSELPFFRTGVPTLVLSSQDRSATICFLDGRIRSPPYLPHSCSCLHRWIFALPPMSLPILCLYKAHQRMYFSFWIFYSVGTRRACPGTQNSSPHYLSEFRSTLSRNQQKLPIISNNNFSFDSIFLRR